MPQEVKVHVHHVSLLRQYDLFVSQLLDFFPEEPVPSVKLNGLDAVEPFVGDIHSILVEFVALVVGLMHVVVEPSVQVQADNHEAEANHEGPAHHVEKLVHAEDQVQWRGDKVSYFITKPD